jgi:hypothetical protein
VALGSKIKLHDVSEEDCDDDFEIVGSQEANPMQGRISDDSPLGRALIGHRAGRDHQPGDPDRSCRSSKYLPLLTTDVIREIQMSETENREEEAELSAEELSEILQVRRDKLSHSFRARGATPSCRPASTARRGQAEITG